MEQVIICCKKQVTASSALAAGRDTRVKHDTYNLSFTGKHPWHDRLFRAREDGRTEICT